MSSLYPCLWFDMQAEEAAHFYASILDDSQLGTATRYGKEGFEIHKMPEGTVMTVTFTLGGVKMMAMNGGPLFKINPSISFFVNCKTLQQTNELWDKLREGGDALMPINAYPWSERYGWIKDRFGMTWQISCTPDIPKQKIRPSMLFTGNVFGRAEEAIQFYTSVFSNSSPEVMQYYPTEDANSGKVLYSEFSLNHFQLIAMDGPGNHNFNFNEAVFYIVECKNQEEIDYYWGKLTSGGKESQCGWLKDKFGVSWQIVPAILDKLIADPAQTERVTNAMLKMKKIDIYKLIKI